MLYKSLRTIYYKDSASWQKEYLARFHSPSARHLDFTISEYNYPKAHQAFYCYNEELALLLNNLLRECLKLTKSINSIPGIGIHQFLSSSLISEIKSSNDIEGVHSTKRDITRAMYHSKPDKYLRLWGIVDKYKKIISDAVIPLHTCEDIRMLYDDFILQEILNDNEENTPDGELFRKGSVDIVGGTQKIIHRGLYPEKKIIAILSYGLKLLYEENIPPIVRLSIFHYMFGYIHPFYDGNGRIGRFITSYLLSKEIHPLVGLSLSRLIKKRRNAYYTLFETTNSDKNCGDLTPFIIGSLEFILGATTCTSNLLEAKLAEWRKYDLILPKLAATDKTTSTLLELLLQAAIFSNIGITIEELVVAIGKSKNTIQSRLRSIPAQYIICDNYSRPYHYKINLRELEK